MNFYHILFALKQGFNRNLTWYENLFVRFYNNTIAKLTAKILRIKGNTVSFNQLVQNGNFADTSVWLTNNIALTVSNNVGSLKCTAIGTNSWDNQISQYKTLSHNHKVYAKCEIKPSHSKIIQLSYIRKTGDAGKNINVDIDVVQNTWNAVKQLTTLSTAQEYERFAINLNMTSANGYSVDDVDEVRNVQLFDLTLMGIDNLTTTAEVEAWLSSHIGDLPYFDYTQGTLVPFMGTGLKTVGFNQWDEEWELGGFDSNGNKTSANDRIRSKNKIQVLPNKTYYLKCPTNDLTYDGLWVWLYDASGNYIGRYGGGGTWNDGTTYTIPSNVGYINFVGAGLTSYSNNICINISNAEKNGTYEPYISNTLSLPTLTYFPSGMKEAGTVYDEASESKATTRLGSIVLDGTQTITFEDFVHFRAGYEISDMEVGSTSAAFIDTNVISNYLPSASNNDTYSSKEGIHRRINGSRQIIIALGSSSGANTRELFTAYLSAHPLTVYYPLATPTSQEVSLDLTYPIWNGGTEQILPVNTSVPTTSGIVADIKYPDGTRYDQTFVYRVIEKATQLGNRALSIMLGKKVETDNPEEPLEILLKGEK